MIIVTGGAGFVGSQIIKALNARGESDIIAVDNLEKGHKFTNLVNTEIADYWDKKELLARIEHGELIGSLRAVLHQGACSTTTEWNGRYMMQNNFTYSKALLHYCQEEDVPFVYASSAAVYGGNDSFREDTECECPLNVYGYSKLLFDQYVRRLLPKAGAPIVGLRYFNVYGPNEQHKGNMASVAYHFNQQLINDGRCRLFEGSDGYGNGEQLRDFVYVEDVVKVNLWFLENPNHAGIFNVGTGRAQSFNDVAKAVIKWHGKGEIEYIPFPEHLKGAYQSYTQADLSHLRHAGYEAPFMSVEEGVKAYLNALN